LSYVNLGFWGHAQTFGGYVGGGVELFLSTKNTIEHLKLAV